MLPTLTTSPFTVSTMYFGASAISPGLAVIAFPSGSFVSGFGIEVSPFLLATTVYVSLGFKLLKVTFDGLPDEPIHPLSLPG